MDIGIGLIFDGKVTGITKFGAFISLPENKTGMVHISEIAHSYVSDIKEHLVEGQEVKVKIIGVDNEGRINLSIKKAIPEAPKPERSPSFNNRRPAPTNNVLTFEDKLKQFMSDSESKISDLKQHSDKRSSRKGKSK